MVDQWITSTYYKCINEIFLLTQVSSLFKMSKWYLNYECENSVLNISQIKNMISHKKFDAFFNSKFRNDRAWNMLFQWYGEITTRENVSNYKTVKRILHDKHWFVMLIHYRLDTGFARTLPKPSYLQYRITPRLTDRLLPHCVNGKWP